MKFILLSFIVCLLACSVISELSIDVAGHGTAIAVAISGLTSNQFSATFNAKENIIFIDYTKNIISRMTVLSIFDDPKQDNIVDVASVALTQNEDGIVTLSGQVDSTDADTYDTYVIVYIPITNHMVGYGRNIEFSVLDGDNTTPVIHKSNDSTVYSLFASTTNISWKQYTSTMDNTDHKLKRYIETINVNSLFSSLEQSFSFIIEPLQLIHPKLSPSLDTDRIPFSYSFGDKPLCIGDVSLTDGTISTYHFIPSIDDNSLVLTPQDGDDITLIKRETNFTLECNDIITVSPAEGLYDNEYSLMVTTFIKDTTARTKNINAMFTNGSINVIISLFSIVVICIGSMLTIF